VSTSTRLGWAGELADPDTGLTYLRAREYSPGTGRFVQRDTVQPKTPGTQGWNPYQYPNGNPATLTDPTGHSAGFVMPDVTAAMTDAIVAQVTTAIQPLVDATRKLTQQIQSAPPMAQPLLVAIAGLMMIALAVVVVARVVAAMPVLQLIGRTLVGGAMFLLRFVQYFTAGPMMLLSSCATGGNRFCQWLIINPPELPRAMCAAGIGFDLGVTLGGGDTNGAGGEAGCGAGDDIGFKKGRLRENLSKQREPQAGEVAHHIVAARDRRAAAWRDILTRFGIGLYDAAKGVFLPANRSSPNPNGAAVHSAAHTNAYYEALEEELSAVTSADGVVRVLDNVRRRLLSGGYP
jgi:RHS repeat-associated protein